MTDLVNIETETREIILSQSITAGDTTHAPSSDVVYGAIAELTNIEVIKVTTDKGTASASTMGKLYIEVGQTETDMYYTVRTESQGRYVYSWHQLETDIFDDITVPTDVSELTDTHNTAFTPKSHDHGDLKNDGTIGTSNNTGKNVVTNNNGKISLEDKPTIPTAGTSTPNADVANGAVGTSANYAKADHQHPLSSAYATSGHSHDISTLPTANSITNGDTTHLVSADVIYDYINSIIGNLEEDMLS